MPIDLARWKPRWTIHKYADLAAFEQDVPFEVSEIDHNLLLNGGITVLWNLVAGSGTAFSNANARIGVGDSATAAAAAQTGLQAATNKTYKVMDATYPQVSAQKITYKATFTGTDANYDWQEFVVDNGTTALNRLVSAQGTKASGSIWTVTLDITLS